MNGVMRLVGELLRDESGGETLESALTLGLGVAAAIFVVTIVMQKVHEGLNALDTATEVTAKQATYKKVLVKDDTRPEKPRGGGAGTVEKTSALGGGSAASATGSDLSTIAPSATPSSATKPPAAHPPTAVPTRTSHRPAPRPPAPRTNGIHP